MTPAGLGLVASSLHFCLRSHFRAIIRKLAAVDDHSIMQLPHNSAALTLEQRRDKRMNQTAERAVCQRQSKAESMMHVLLIAFVHILQMCLGARHH